MKSRYGIWLMAGVSLSAMALYFSSLIGGVSVLEMVSGFPPPGAGRTLLLGVGATALIGTAAGATGRWLYARYQQNRLPITAERRRRAQACVRNLQDAVGYLTVKAKLHEVVGDPSELGNNTSLLFVERLWILQQMLARRQPNTPAVAALPPEVPRLSSR